MGDLYAEAIEAVKFLLINNLQNNDWYQAGTVGQALRILVDTKKCEPREENRAARQISTRNVG